MNHICLLIIIKSKARLLLRGKSLVAAQDTTLLFADAQVRRVHVVERNAVVRYRLVLLVGRGGGVRGLRICLVVLKGLKDCGWLRRLIVETTVKVVVEAGRLS